MTSRLSSFNHKKKKILFVDDEHDMTLIFKKALESVGFSVDAFNDSERALKNLTLNHVSMIWQYSISYA
ncbi:MAG TPA: hypothetical protein VGW09_04715 [Nitrososphaeraceae archaeon]|nr:hypothetical protein [Nitrososphaeraceae archaeon]